MRNPKNILQHELIGMHCKVISSQNRYQIGIKGKIIDETLKTILIKSGNERKNIQKKGTIFRITLSDKKIDVDGNFLLARPEDRIKQK